MRRLSFLLALSLISGAARAQGIPVKAAITAATVTGCAIPVGSSPNSPATLPPNADEEARSLISDAQEAALQGEHAAARDGFARALALSPGNARVAYYLAREHEALNENALAVVAYCRYIGLQPNAPDADEVRGRIVRLTPASELRRLDEARANFQSGVALLQRRQYAAADSVFDAVSKQVPGAPEPFYNRGLARAARGDRANALQQFERYLDLAPQAADRAAVRAAMTRLPDRVYGPGQAFLAGLALPGLGQMSTGRSILGVLVLGATGGAVAFGVRPKEKMEEMRYTDPFGNPYRDSVSTTSRPLLVPTAAAAGALWLGSALESIAFARRSRRRAESVIAAGLTTTPAEGVSARLAVRALREGRIGVGLSLR